jgi:hypothetical protein
LHQDNARHAFKIGLTIILTLAIAAGGGAAGSSHCSYPVHAPAMNMMLYPEQKLPEADMVRSPDSAMAHMGRMIWLDRLIPE